MAKKPVAPLTRAMRWVKSLDEAKKALEMQERRFRQERLLYELKLALELRRFYGNNA